MILLVRLEKVAMMILGLWWRTALGDFLMVDTQLMMNNWGRGSCCRGLYLSLTLNKSGRGCRLLMLLTLYSWIVFGCWVLILQLMIVIHLKMALHVDVMYLSEFQIVIFHNIIANHCTICVNIHIGWIIRLKHFVTTDGS